MRDEGSDTVELVSIPRKQESPKTNGLKNEKNTGKGTITSSKRLNKKLGGIRNWKISLVSGAIASVIVLFFNLGFVLWAISHYELEDAGSRGTLYFGHCDKARKLSVGFHLIINVLATALLSASNYAMQCLCAPTQRDIGRAHEQQTWLDIGVPSLRNLTWISKKSTILWGFLALSNLPLHLVYNSTVFLTKSANAYDIFIGNSSLTSPESVVDIEVINGIVVSNSTPTNPDFAVGYPYPNRFDLHNIPEFKSLLTRLHEVARAGELVRLENSDCMKSYLPTYQSTNGNVILVASDYHSPGLEFTMEQPIIDPESYDWEPSRWICSGLRHGRHERHYDASRCSSFISDSGAHTDWVVRSYDIRYCLSEKVPEKCKLQYSLPLAIVVISFNLIKVIIILVVALTSADIPILTSGDAIAFFMRTPDETTKGKCLVPREHLAPRDHLAAQYDPQGKYSREPQRWGSAVSLRRWFICLLSYVVAIVLTVALLARGLSTAESDDNSQLWKIALGAVNPRTIIKGDNWPTSIVANTIIANIPQVVFSILYFASNSVFTTMTLSAEWADYAVERKGLRVSATPQGAQRSTYFLSLPYRYGIPLIAFSTLLHWLISQSLFLVAIHAYSPTQHRDLGNDLVSCGFSPVAIVTTICVGVVMLLCLSGTAFRRFKSGMPVAGSNSLAMSAACHSYSLAREDECDGGNWLREEYLPLKWGAVPFPGQHEVGHCTFSSEEVETPRDGFLYS